MNDLQSLLKDMLILSIPYLVVVCLLSSIAFVYAWDFSYSCIKEVNNDEITINQLTLLGIGNGGLFFICKECKGKTGFVLKIHPPEFPIQPFYAGGFIETAGIWLSFWFIGLISWIVHSLVWPLSRRIKRNKKEE